MAMATVMATDMVMAMVEVMGMVTVTGTENTAQGITMMSLKKRKNHY